MGRRGHSDASGGCFVALLLLVICVLAAWGSVAWGSWQCGFVNCYRFDCSTGKCEERSLKKCLVWEE